MLSERLRWHGIAESVLRLCRIRLCCCVSRRRMLRDTGGLGTGSLVIHEGKKLLVVARTVFESLSLKLWYSFSTPAVLLPYSYGTPTVLLRHSCGSPTVLLRYSFRTPSVLLRYSYGTPTALLRYSYSPPTVLLLYSYGTPTALLQYSCGTHTGLLRFSYRIYWTYLSNYQKYSFITIL